MNALIKINGLTLALAKTTLFMLLGFTGEAKMSGHKIGETKGSSRKVSQMASPKATQLQLTAGSPPISENKSVTAKSDTSSNPAIATDTLVLTVCSDQLPYFINGISFAGAGEYSVQSTAENSTQSYYLKLSVSEPAAWYPDADGDGYGNGNRLLTTCDAPAGYVQNSSDCNDSDGSVHEPIEYFVDSDKDGFGSETSVSLCVSVAPKGYSRFSTDCDDSNASLNPNSVIRCKGIRNELNAVSVSVYPNVGTGQYTLALDKVEGEVSLALYDARGIQIWEKATQSGQSSEQFNIETQPSGIYWLMCRTEGFAQNLRVVKL